MLFHHPYTITTIGSLIMIIQPKATESEYIPIVKDIELYLKFKFIFKGR